MSSAKLITWSVRPDTNWPYEFFGSIIFGGNASGSVSLWEQGFGYEGKIDLHKIKKLITELSIENCDVSKIIKESNKNE